MDTILDLEARVQKLERETAALRQLIAEQSLGESPISRGRRLLSRGRFNAIQKSSVTQAFEAMGIDHSSVSAEELRQMMAADGVIPEENLFSRGIQEMREE